MTKRFYALAVIMIFILAASLRLATIWCGTNVDEGGVLGRRTPFV